LHDWAFGLATEVAVFGLLSTSVVNTSQRSPRASSPYAAMRYSPAPKRFVISEIEVGPDTMKSPSSVRFR